MDPQLSSGRAAEGRAWPCKRGWQRHGDGQAEALLTMLPWAEAAHQPIGMPGRLFNSFQSREGHVQFRGS